MNINASLFFIICIHLTAFPSSHFFESEEVPEYKNVPPIEYVKATYEINLHGIDCLLYPAKNPKRLWVLFNGATVNRYTMWSWFWDTKEAWEDTTYLFLKDDRITWYLGSEKEPLTSLYCAIITDIMRRSNLSPSDVYMIGHSMGGYAALYYGLLLHVGGIFALRPQIDWYHGIQYFSIKKLEKIWVNIDELILKTKYIPYMYLQFGEFGPDKGAGETCISALLKKKACAIVEKTMNASHMGYHPTKEFINATLSYFELIQNYL